MLKLDQTDVLGFGKHALNCTETVGQIFTLLSASPHIMYVAVSALRRAATQPALSLSLSLSLKTLACCSWPAQVSRQKSSLLFMFRRFALSWKRHQKLVYK